jgi:hypothetical protein
MNNGSSLDIDDTLPFIDNGGRRGVCNAGISAAFFSNSLARAVAQARAIHAPLKVLAQVVEMPITYPAPARFWNL